MQRTNNNNSSRRSSSTQSRVLPCSVLAVAWVLYCRFMRWIGPQMLGIFFWLHAAYVIPYVQGRVRNWPWTRRRMPTFVALTALIYIWYSFLPLQYKLTPDVSAPIPVLLHLCIIPRAPSAEEKREKRWLNFDIDQVDDGDGNDDDEEEDIHYERRVRRRVFLPRPERWRDLAPGDFVLLLFGFGLASIFLRPDMLYMLIAMIVLRILDIWAFVQSHSSALFFVALVGCMVLLAMGQAMLAVTFISIIILRILFLGMRCCARSWYRGFKLCCVVFD